MISTAFCRIFWLVYTKFPLQTGFSDNYSHFRMQLGWLIVRMTHWMSTENLACNKRLGEKVTLFVPNHPRGCQYLTLTDAAVSDRQWRSQTFAMGGARHPEGPLRSRAPPPNLNFLPAVSPISWKYGKTFFENIILINIILIILKIWKNFFCKILQKKT